MIFLSEVHVEVTDGVSAKPSEKRLRLFEHDFALNVRYTFLEYTLCSNKSIRMENSVV